MNLSTISLYTPLRDNNFLFLLRSLGISHVWMLAKPLITIFFPLMLVFLILRWFSQNGNVSRVYPLRSAGALHKNAWRQSKPRSEKKKRRKRRSFDGYVWFPSGGGTLCFKTSASTRLAGTAREQEQRAGGTACHTKIEREELSRYLPRSRHSVMIRVRCRHMMNLLNDTHHFTMYMMHKYKLDYS